MRKEYFLSLAKNLSKKSNHHSHKIGCLIVKGNKVLGAGCNLMKTHPKSPHPFHSSHAEFMAVAKANYKIKGATAYIYREQKNGTPAISRPCESCWNFLIEHGLKQIVYSFQGNFKQENLK